MRYAYTRFWNNLDKIIFRSNNIYGIPEIRPEQYEPVDKWIGFNYVNSCKNRSRVGVHFFVDDYQFERIWGSWDRYSDILSQFGAVMSPDWSYYNNWPFAVSLWNHYRKHYIAAYLQRIGKAKVYPTICWGNRRTYRWCFDGEPRGGTVCVSSVGTQRTKEDKIGFIDGYEAMMDTLKPTTVLFYGQVPKECKGNIVHITQFYSKFEEDDKND